MSQSVTRLEKRLQFSGILLIAGLVVEILSLRWSHPTAFLLFLLLGGILIVAGILLYLYALLSEKPAPAQIPESTD